MSEAAIKAMKIDFRIKLVPSTLYQNSFCSLGKANVFVAENKNLTLKARRARLAAAQNAKSPLKQHWAALCAARAKIGQIEESLILVRLYEAARTHFIANS